MTIAEQVLEILRSEGAPVSGERIAQRLGVSRNAVWKAVQQLKAEGCELDAATNRGYELLKPESVITVPAIEEARTAKVFGSTIELHRELGSTNARAKQLAAQGAKHGTLVIADSQTAGRGRFGRRFESPSGRGVYMSFVLRPELPAERAVMITSMTAVAVARAIERLADVDIAIKWVNDLYAGGKKVCGILCEAGVGFESGQLEYVVVGIGVNTARGDFPPELADIATSVGNVCGRDIPRAALIAQICNCMEELYPGLADGAFMEESRRRSNVIGRRVVVMRGGEQWHALAVDIDDEGSLVVETPEGRKTVHSGEISVRWEEKS